MNQSMYCGNVFSLVKKYKNGEMGKIMIRCWFMRCPTRNTMLTNISLSYLGPYGINRSIVYPHMCDLHGYYGGRNDEKSLNGVASICMF